MLVLQDTDAVPDPVTLLGVMLPQTSPDGTVSVRLTVPPKLSREVTVTVVRAELPASTGPGELAAIAKSRFWKRAVALCTNAPLLPDSVRV
jgi:hypothetical protein